MGLCHIHPTSLLLESYIPPDSFPFIFADSQLHCGCHTSLMPKTVPCCHGNNHFKKQYNKISNNESFSSLYQSPEGEGKARNRTQPSRKNNDSLDQAIRPLDFPLFFPVSFMHSQTMSGSMQILHQENVKVSVRQWRLLSDYLRLLSSGLQSPYSGC